MINFLVLKGDINCGGLEIMMVIKEVEFLLKNNVRRL